MGRWDFAGGTVVHVNAGRPALVRGAGGRQAAPTTVDASILPHKRAVRAAGAGLLWFGWFGFNAGSAVPASPIAGLASHHDAGPAARWSCGRSST
jgi:Amt family ammonium transporter